MENHAGSAECISFHMKTPPSQCPTSHPHRREREKTSGSSSGTTFFFSANAFFSKMNSRAFYEGRRKVEVDPKECMTIEDMHDQMDFDTIESSHTFIQWIFPIDTASQFNKDAALLDIDSAVSISRNPCCILRVKESFIMMLEFFGFCIQDDDVIVACDEARLAHLVSHPHNWLRISRILRSLVLIGLSSFADAFFRALRHEVNNGRLRACLKSCNSFWCVQAYAETLKGFPTTTCLEQINAMSPHSQIALSCAIIRCARCRGAQRLLHTYFANQIVIVGIASSKKTCLLAPYKMRLVVLDKMRRRLLSLRQVLAEPSNHALCGYAIYKSVRRSLAYNGPEELCRVPFLVN